MGKTVGIILIVLGIVLLIWTEFTYTKKEKIIDAGAIQVSADKQETVNWPPYAGAIVLIAGVIVLLSSNSKKST